MLQITEWRERYEVTDKGHVPKESDLLRAGPLRFIRSQVHGYSLGNGFRKLQIIAGDKKMEVFGIFQKLLELAGSSRILPDSPDFSRRGILRVTPNGEPASIDDLAFLLDIQVEQVAHAVKVLTDKRLRWLQEIPGKVGKSREKSGRLLEPSTTTSAASAASAAQFKKEFSEDFWPKVPQGYKIGLAKARDAYILARKKGVPKEKIIGGLPTYHHNQEARRASSPDDFRPLHPATWLNGERWTDDRTGGDAVHNCRLKPTGPRPSKLFLQRQLADKLAIPDELKTQETRNDITQLEKNIDVFE